MQLPKSVTGAMFEYTDKEKSKYLMCYLTMISFIFTNSEEENN